MQVRLLGRPVRWDLPEFCQWFERSQIPVWIWIVAVWALFVFPAIDIRAFHYEEGTVVGLARGAFEDGHWLAPHLYGQRFVERPVLMSWIIAGIGMISGGVDEWIARIPTVASLLIGGGLIFSFVRRHANAAAALFAAACFFVSPIILQKVIVAEPDVMLSVLLFAAFVIWWNGYETGGAGFLRWCTIAALLVLAGLTKGPQPVAYFGLGVGAFLLLRRQWSALVWLALAGAVCGLVTVGWYWLIYQPGDLTLWAEHSRLTRVGGIATRLADIVKFAITFGLEMLPSLVLAAPLAVILVRKDRRKHNDLAMALLLYSLCCTVALMVWPHGLVRYTMPASLALAVLAGLGFERFRIERPKLANAALLVVAVLGVYQIAWSWIAMPLWSSRFERSRRAGELIASTVRARPGPLYATADYMDKNILLYVPAPIRAVPFRDILTAPPPGWALVSPDRAHEIETARPIGQHITVSQNPTLDLVELRAR